MAFTWSKTLITGTDIGIANDLDYDLDDIDANAVTIAGLHCPSNYTSVCTDYGDKSYDSTDRSFDSDHSNQAGG